MHAASMVTSLTLCEGHWGPSQGYLWALVFCQAVTSGESLVKSFRRQAALFWGGKMQKPLDCPFQPKVTGALQ